MRRTSLLLTILAWICLGVVACGGSASGPAIYMASSPDGVMLLRWSASEGAVTGSLTAFNRNDYQTAGGNAETVSFTGTLADESVSLVFESDSGVDPWTGTIRGSDLLVTFPGAAGQLQAIEFKTATEADYNEMVAGFASQAAVVQATAAARDQQNAPVVSAVSALSQALEELTSTAFWAGADTPLDQLGMMADQDWNEGTRKAVAEMKDNRKNKSMCDSSRIIYDVYFGEDFKKSWRDVSDHPGQPALLKEYIDQLEPLLTRVESAAAALDSAAAANQGADRPSASSAAARTLVSEYRASISAAQTKVEKARAEAMKLRDEAATYLCD